MAHTITDAAELVRYHLVLAEPDDSRANDTLVQFAERAAGGGEPPLVAEALWVFCDRCGCSIDADLIHPDGHHYSDEDDFYCRDCWDESFP